MYWATLKRGRSMMISVKTGSSISNGELLIIISNTTIRKAAHPLEGRAAFQIFSNHFLEAAAQVLVVRGNAAHVR